MWKLKVVIALMVLNFLAGICAIPSARMAATATATIVRSTYVDLRQAGVIDLKKLDDFRDGSLAENEGEGLPGFLLGGSTEYIVLLCWRLGNIISGSGPRLKGWR